MNKPLSQCTIGVALTGSFCTLDEVMDQLQKLADMGATLIPIISKMVASTDTRFGTAEYFRRRLVSITGREPIETIEDAEPIGPKAPFDVLLVAPCTGNTLARLAHGITDTPVTMACKAHIRNGKPLVLSIATNDALAGNAKNIAEMLNRHHVYFVPFGQDDYVKKVTSMVASCSLIPETLEHALQGKQIQPILLPGKA